METVAIDVAPVRAQPAGVGLYVALLTRELVRSNALPLALIGVRPDARALEGLGDELPRKAFSARTYHAWMQLAAERDARSARRTPHSFHERRCADCRAIFHMC